MANLFQNPDGADAQSRAVLAYLSGHDGIECSWDNEGKRYLAAPEIARWHNCREEGYVVSMRGYAHQKQINIAFFEHRNSDDICAIKWNQVTINPPTIDTMDTKGTIYKDKYDLSHRETFGHPQEMADWIYNQLSLFWEDTFARRIEKTNDKRT